MNSPAFDPAQVEIDVVTSYLPDHSRPDQAQYTFAYTITISNRGEVPVQLMSRHWLITDADQQVQEVRGEGVVGEQPVIPPGGAFRYTSGATLRTPVGAMQGSYFMLTRGDADAGTTAEFSVPIPPFSLHTPTALN
jgi:ApaG protein